jgi:hypothetical protein
MPGTASCGGPLGIMFGATDVLGRPGRRFNTPEIPFRSVRGTASYRIAGVSRDANGNPLPLCTVTLFETGTDRIVQKVVSEAVTGVFAFSVPDTTTRYYAVFYLAGAPDVAGTTVNTLVGA